MLKGGFMVLWLGRWTCYL